MSKNLALKIDSAPAASAKIGCKPFLKWVGGKGQLLPELCSRLPTDFNRYFEPFVGGGAMFFALQPQNAHISDINAELINCYQVVKTDVEALIRSLKKHRYDKNYFYKIRNIDRHSSFSRLSAVERASRLIFLNKSCYNGLFRVNSKGEFNTPFGSYKNPKILDAANLRACSEALQSVSIQVAKFDQLQNQISAGDFVYFDPPYVPLNSTSYFTSYSQAGFDLSMQRELYELCVKLDKRGVKFMLSNSSAGFIKKLYKPFRVSLVSASRAINSVGSKRGLVKEVIVTNY